MKAEIDQSGKIEQTHLDTVIGLSNDEKISVCIPRKLKRELLVEFRVARSERIMSQLLFAFGVAMILVMYGKPNRVVVDTEYYKHEGLLTKWINVFLKQMRPTSIYNFSFKQIGKLSPAHTYCKKVAHKEVVPTKAVTQAEMNIYIMPLLAQKKTESRIHGQRSA